MTYQEYVESKNELFVLATTNGGEIPLRSITGTNADHYALKQNRVTYIPNRWAAAVYHIRFCVNTRRVSSGGWYISRPMTYKQYRNQIDWYKREVEPSDI